MFNPSKAADILSNAELEAADPVLIMINIGCGFDIPTGHYLPGRRGESVLNGGLGFFTGTTSIANAFKSTQERWMMLTAMSRMPYSTSSTYDCEINIHEWQQRGFFKAIREFRGEDILRTQRWKITNKVKYLGNEYYENQRDFVNNKIKNRKNLEVETPFFDRDGKTPLLMMVPTFDEIDSLTEFETKDVADMQADNELGDSGANTMHMRQGLAKQRMIMEIPRLAGSGFHYWFMTAQLGKESSMQNAGPGGQVPIKKMNTLKNGDKMKGVTDKFTFATHNCWYNYNVKPLIADDKMGPKYPSGSDDKTKMDTDLNEISVRLLRSKSGPSGFELKVIASQSQGILPSLSEFHNLMEMAKFGISGNNVNYALDIYPDCSLSRTTVRGKIDTDHRLRRALNITMELMQMAYLWRGKLNPKYRISPKQLYEGLKAKGYNWDVLLDTRGWWTYIEDGLPPFLSTMDLLRMYNDEYIPFWMNEDKTIKPGYTLASDMDWMTAPTQYGKEE